MAMQQAIDKIVKNLPRDDAEKGIDGPGEPNTHAYERKSPFCKFIHNVSCKTNKH